MTYTRKLIIPITFTDEVRTSNEYPSHSPLPVLIAALPTKASQSTDLLVAFGNRRSTSSKRCLDGPSAMLLAVGTRANHGYVPTPARACRVASIRLALLATGE